MNITPKVIDLYHEDDVTSFADIYGAGIRGVLHKATEGATVIDNAYASRQSEAEAVGLLWGAYHFWRPEDSAEAQAQRFLAAAGAAPRWALDYEVSGGTPTTIVAIMKLIQAGTTGKMTLYGPKDILEELIASATDEEKAFLSQADLWWAEYGDAPSLSDALKALWPNGPWLWQYTESGKIAGVSNETDLNSFSGTDADLQNQWPAGATEA
jgi:lysozyme